MALAERAAPVAEDTQHAFDGVAATYDRSNAENPGLVAMRRRALSALSLALPGGGRVLDLGCGPGTDEPRAGGARLPGDGHRLVAGDGRRGAATGARGRALRSRRRPPSRHPRARPPGAGTLRRRLLEFRSAQLRRRTCRQPPAPSPGASAPAACWWRRSSAASARGRSRSIWRAATGGAPGVRFSRAFVPVPLERRRVWTRYYTPASSSGRLSRPASRANPCARSALLAPPPYLRGVRRSPSGPGDALWRVDDAVGHWPGVRTWGDHFLIVLQKRGGLAP